MQGLTWGRLVAAQDQVGRSRSAPPDLSGTGESQDPRLHPEPHHALPEPRQHRDLPPRRPDVLVPGAVVAPWGRRALAGAPSPVAPAAGHTCPLNQHLPASPNDSRELIIPQPREALGDIGGVTPWGPCPSSAGTVSLPKVTWSIPGCSCPTLPPRCLQGGFCGPAGGFGGRGMAVAWPCPVAAVAVVTAVTPRPAGAPSPPFPTDPLTELLRKTNFPARIP